MNLDLSNPLEYENYDALFAGEDYDFSKELKQFENDPSNPLFNPPELSALFAGEEYDVKKELKYSIENDPKNPLFGQKEEEDFAKNKLVNELISLYKQLHLEATKGIPMSKRDKTRLRLIDQLARKNKKTVSLACKLQEQYRSKYVRNINLPKLLQQNI